MPRPSIGTHTMEEMVRGDRDYLWHHIKPHKVFENTEQMIIVSGKGLRVTDIRGREYLDATSGGVWSVMVGHGRESIAEAVYEQLKTLGYYAGTVGNVPPLNLPPS
jgi:taurine-pyruvate aminotransferase